MLILSQIYIPLQSITKCFNDMTKNGAVFKWTKECDAAFKLLKEKLMEEPVLINPQVNRIM